MPRAHRGQSGQGQSRLTSSLLPGRTPYGVPHGPHTSMPMVYPAIPNFLHHNTSSLRNQSSHYPGQAPCGICFPAGPRAGFVRATMGHHGHAHTGPGQIPVRTRSNPVKGPIRDLAAHSGHARSNPVRAPAGAAIWASTNVSHRKSTVGVHRPAVRALNNRHGHV